MTPEQVERTIEFILSSQAESAVRMDRLEESFIRLGENFIRLEENFIRLEENFHHLIEEHARYRTSLREQKENIDVLLNVTHDLVRVSRLHEERLKRLES